ncbi:MAG: flagellar export chaperone FliS [Nitrosomonas sp.]|nr:flagellar export chaperone FliS [Nitrosomonas sp.]
MFSSSSRAISAYNKVGAESGVFTADPHKLVLMLFEGAQQALNRSKLYIRQNEIAARGEMISKAIMIIDHGLKASLDVKAGGALAEQLSQLYDYMTDRLLQANLRSNIDIIDEVSQLLGELHEAWAVIGKKPGTSGKIAQIEKSIETGMAVR